MQLIALSSLSRIAHAGPLGISGTYVGWFLIGCENQFIFKGNNGSLHHSQHHHAHLFIYLFILTKCMHHILKQVL